MKNLFKYLLVISSVAGANAATITISPGIGASNGLLVTDNGIAATSQFLAVGSWDANTSTFTQFASTIAADTGTVNGQFVGTAPTSVNNQTIHLYVSLGSSVDFAADGKWVLMRTSASTKFPSDVSSVLASATATFSTFTTSIVVANSDNFEAVGTRTINFVPEPSTALLGAIGALGLLRRRRN